MALLDERLEAGLIAASALTVGAVLLRRLSPELPPAVRSLAASGLKLFAEAEFEMQDGIIGKLAKNAVDALLDAMPSGSPATIGDTAHRIVSNFEHTARARSERHGWHERDKRARYRHHVRKLKAAIAHASRDLPAAQQAYLSQAEAVIAEDW